MRFLCRCVAAAAALVLVGGMLGQAASRAARPARKVDAPSLVNRPDAWFASAEGKAYVENILTWQGHGPGGVMGWPKAYDASLPRPVGDAAVAGIEWDGIATIDNGATTSELRILARAVTLNREPGAADKVKAAFEKALDAMLAGQYENGGWPQRFPPPKNYGSHITFNDNAMTLLMTEMKEIGAGKAPFAFVDEGRKAKAQAAFERGVACILNCQIVVGGTLTGWCAQHDEVTLKPAGARAYELPSISGSEGAAVALLLMTIDKPDDRVKHAVEAAATWFEAAKISGKRVAAARAADGSPDRVVVDDPNGALWARFYDLETGKPFFCGRDGIKKASLAEIEQERRTGYAWYGTWGARVATEYAAWKRRTGQ